MIVQCPYCASRYRVDAARLSVPDAKLRCSRCQHVFSAPATDRRPAGPAARSGRGTNRPDRPPAAAESLTLPFEQASWKDEGDHAERPATTLTLPDTDDEFTLGTEPPASPAPGGAAAAAPVPPPEVEAGEHDAAGTGLAAAAEPSGGDDVSAQAFRPSAAEPLTIDIDRPEPRGRTVRPPRPAREEDMAGADRGKMLAILWFLGVVTLGYGILTAALLAHPGLAEQWLGNLPWIGNLRDDRLLTRKVALSEVTGSYQRIREGRDVFVISGKALNTAPVPLHGVQIAGRLLDAQGRGLDEKVIHCGNVISTRVLKDLGPRELSVLQEVKPPNRFTIEPGASSTFVIVFLDPPKEAVSFSAYVTAARRQG